MPYRVDGQNIEDNDSRKVHATVSSMGLLY